MGFLSDVGNFFKGIFGGGGGPSAAQIRAQIEAAQRQAVAEIQAQNQAALEQAGRQHAQAMAAAASQSQEAQKRLEAQFRAQQEADRAEFDKNRKATEKEMDLMRADIAAQLEVSEKLRVELEKPVKDMQNKVDFINALRRPIIETDKLLTIGFKGMFKSTWLWLAGLNPDKPAAPEGGGDGSVKVLYLPGCVDSIGMNGWNHTDVIKQIVLFIRYGMPRDLVVFTNDRISAPTTSLALLGITNPMIVSMHSSFWSNLEDGDFGLVPTPAPSGDRVIQRVEPVSKLRKCYNTRVKDMADKLHLGHVLTHHDDLDRIRADRAGAVRPFQHLLDQLGTVYQVQPNNGGSGYREMLFRFVYIYERKYRDQKDGDLNFVNKATLDMFDEPF